MLRLKNNFSQVLFITPILLVTIILIPPTSSLGIIDEDNDAGLGRDAGDTKVTADELPSGSYNGRCAHTGPIGIGHDVDWYKIHCLEDQFLVVTMRNYFGDLDLDIWEGNILIQSIGGEEKRETNFFNTRTKDAVYYIKIYMDSEWLDTGGDYSLTISLISHDDAGSGSDAGEESTGAVLIEEGQYEGSSFKGLDNIDFYKLHVEANDTVKVTLDSWGQNYDIIFFSSYPSS